MTTRSRIIGLLLIFFLGLPSILFAIDVEITATVPGCGNGTIENGEQCDGVNFGGALCSTLGYTGGNLSCTSVCTFQTSACTNSSGGGGGGGGGASSVPPVVVPDTNVIFSGRAYPLSRVSILKDGQLALTTIAGPDSLFTATMSGLSTGTYQFSVYGEDAQNRRSGFFTFSIFITSGVTTKISGIFIAPTIAVDKTSVKHGETMQIFGQSMPNSTVTINVRGSQELFLQRPSDDSGAYLLQLDTTSLQKGGHTTKSKSTFQTEVSQYGNPVSFTVGDGLVVAPDQSEMAKKTDINTDGRINLIDFSIVAFWYRRPSPPASVDMNKDGKIDLVDFSIMAYYWTG